MKNENVDDNGQDIACRDYGNHKPTAPTTDVKLTTNEVLYLIDLLEPLSTKLGAFHARRILAKCYYSKITGRTNANNRD